MIHHILFEEKQLFYILYMLMEAAKKLFLVARPLKRGGGAGAHQLSKAPFFEDLQKPTKQFTPLL